MSSEDLRVISGGWWIAALLGVMSVVAGIIVVAKPSNSLATLAVVSGIFVLVDGIVALAQALGPDTESRGLVAVLGVVSVIVGIVLIRHPLAGVSAVALLLGLWLIAAGAVRVVVALTLGEHRLRRLLVAAVLVIVGIVIVSSPHIGYATLAVVVGIGFIAYGAAMIVLGIAIRMVGHGAHSGAPHDAVTT
jgi:uncharacterized membrane protein HdeD (DUF308 family)